MSRRVLVVEDNAPSRDLLCDWLELEGYEAESVEDVKKGQSAVERRPPDLVLLDVKLGDEDGLQLAQWMRRRPDLQHIPVIAVTAHAMLTEQARILQSGCNAYIAKPVDFELLRAALRRWLAALGLPGSPHEGRREPHD